MISSYDRTIIQMKGANMPILTCECCSSSFYAKPNRLMKGWAKYCSNSCKYSALKKGSHVACTTCGKEVYKSKRDLSRSQSGKFFCTKSCQTIWRNSTLYSGERHANWKGGESAYRDIMRRAGTNMICGKCQTKDTRVLAVHHKDRNRRNNDVSNLMWLCHNCHYLVHHFADEAVGFVLR